MTEHKIIIPIRDAKELINANSRKHWTDRKTKTNYWRPAGLKAAKEAALPVLMPYAEINVWVYKPRRGRYDPSNLYPTAKAIIDGLTDYRLIEDDDYKHLDGPHMHHGGFDKENPRFEIIIKELP